jgi:hypothetical protein
MRDLSKKRGVTGEVPGLFPNRLLWLGASVRALSLRGSGCRNLALRAFANKPPPTSIDRRKPVRLDSKTSFRP